MCAQHTVGHCWERSFLLVVGAVPFSPCSLCLSWNHVSSAWSCIPHLHVATESIHFCSELAVAAALGSCKCDTWDCATICTAPLDQAVESRETGLNAAASAYRAPAVNEYAACLTHWLCRSARLPQFTDRTVGEEHKDSSRIRPLGRCAMPSVQAPYWHWLQPVHLPGSVEIAAVVLTKSQDSLSHLEPSPFPELSAPQNCPPEMMKKGPLFLSRAISAFS